MDGKVEALAVASLFLFGSIGLCQSPEPGDFAIRLLPPESTGTVTAYVYSQEHKIQGWALGVCHDPSKATVLDAVPSRELDRLRDGEPVGYLKINVFDRGVVQAVVVGPVYEYIPDASRDCGPFPDGLPAMEIHYRVEEDTTLAFCDDLGDPLIITTVVHEGNSFSPATQEGAGLVRIPYEDMLSYKVVPPVSSEVVTVKLFSETGGIQGWSFGLCHPSGKAEVVEYGAPLELERIHQGEPPDFLALNLVEDWPDSAIIEGVILSHYAAYRIGPFPDGLPVLRIRYDVLDECPTRFCVMGHPPIVNVVVIDGYGYEPATREGGLLVLEALGVSFIRGDANRDGVVNVADPVTILAGIFAGGDLPCEDAADVNDVGPIDLSDAIYLLYYLFSGSYPPLPPFPRPGEDLTRDDPYDCAR